MQDFLCGLTGEIVTPLSPIYGEARQGFNTAVQKFPFIIVYCEDKKDVSNAVCWAGRHGMPLRIRSGGHNYEGYSNGDCVLVIDISRMNHMYIDECANRLIVQAGVTNGQVYQFVSSKGYPFPGGTCPTVGVSGYALGGGWGLSCRLFGLGCDSLTEIELVNYEGVILKADREKHCDLFWACRGGGGGNFGVVVSMTFCLPPKVEQVTLIELDYLNVTSQEQVEFLSVWQEWLKTADKRVTLISRIYNSEADGLAMLVRGIFYGTELQAMQSMAPFLALRGVVSSIQSMSFLEAVTIIGSTYPRTEKFQAVSRFAHRAFTLEEREDLAALIQERPQGSVFAGISMYALGGRVAEIETEDSAFFYRHGRYILWLETVWEEEQFAQENREWVHAQFPCIEAITMGSYVNFPYSALPSYLEEYYGYHAGILEKIKKRYDPKNIFSFPQGIGKSKTCHIDCALEQALDVGGAVTPASGENYRGFRYVSAK